MAFYVALLLVGEIADLQKAVDIVAVTLLGRNPTGGGMRRSEKPHILESTANGVLALDYDFDGFVDLFFASAYRLPRGSAEDERSALYRNNGDGTFSDVTLAAGVDVRAYGHGGCVGDFDADGLPDIYLTILGPNILFRNNGDGTFTDVSKASGVAAVSAPGMGMVSADYDRDGDTDVFVANDGKPNFLFENDGRGRFREVGLIRGFAYDLAGRVHASMGVDCADFDNDGHLDLHVTSFQKELATL